MLTNQSNSQSAHSLIHHAADGIGAVIATGAATSPWWRDRLHIAATLATDLAPIFGVVWLAVQIIHKLSHWAKR
jgi:hypothetical protein